MITRTNCRAAALLALFSLAVIPGAGAAPIPFMDPGGNVLGGAFAGLDGLDDFDVAAPPLALPVQGSAQALSSDGDMATAMADVGLGTLGNSLGLAPLTGETGANALASFSGNAVAPGGDVTLQLDLASTLMLDGLGALGATELGYTVLLDGAVVVDETVLLDSAHDFMDSFTHLLAPAAGSLLSLEAFLFSEALASAGSAASGQANARFVFDAAVDAPIVASAPHAFLLLAGALLVTATGRRRHPVPA